MRATGHFPLVLTVIALLSCTLERQSARPPDESAGASRQPALQGAWRSSLQFSSGAFAGIKDLEFMYVFNAGGTMTESSNYDAAPPVPPAYGTWKQTGPSQYELHYEFYITAPSAPDAFKTGAGWVPAGRGIFTEKLTLSPDGNSFTSEMNYEAFDVSGAPMEGGGKAQGRGVRM